MSIHVARTVSTAPSGRPLGTAAVQVSLLGGLHVRVGTAVVGPRQLGGVKPRHLLIALAVARGVPVSKEALVSILWGDDRPAAATATLESYVCVLRKHLQVPGAPRQGTIMTRAGCYSLDLDQVDLDVAALARDVGRALHPSVRPDLALPLLRRTLAVARTPLLPDEASALWLDAARAEHERMTSEWLVAAAEKVVDLAPGDATRWARQAIEADSLDEGAWYAYLHSKDVSGHHAEGLSEAVVRLHRVSRGGFAAGDVPDSGPDSGTGRRGPAANEARHALAALVRCASSAPSRPIR